MDDSGKMFRSLGDAVASAFGEGVSITKKMAVSGGDINRAYLLLLSDGRKAFVKENAAANLDFFVKESAGLAAIRGMGVLDVPDTYGYGTDGNSSFLLMGAVESGRRIPDYYRDFGIRLAQMHSKDCTILSGGRYGFIHDNYIGAGRQENTPEDTWVGFFRDRRLLPQFRRAEHYFDEQSSKAFGRLLERLDRILTEPARPALLHGDLWFGNHMVGLDGKAWLIDPAVYVGHPEADIAMTELFGGFPAAFYAGYYEQAGMADGYEERRDIYNLYHLLNHLNLFGAEYLAPVMEIVWRYAGAQ